MTYDPHDILARFHRALVRELHANDPEALTSPFSVAEIYQNLVPYRTHRDEIGVEMNGDYEHALLRLLAGEGEFLTIESRTARQEIREELESPNPNTSLYRDFAAADVLLNPDKIDEALAAPETSGEELDEAVPSPEDEIPEEDLVESEEIESPEAVTQEEEPEEGPSEEEEPEEEPPEEDDSVAGLTVAVSLAPPDEDEESQEQAEEVGETVLELPEEEGGEEDVSEVSDEAKGEAEGETPEAEEAEESVSEDLQEEWKDPSSWLEPSIETLREEYETSGGASLVESGEAIPTGQEVASGELPFELSVQEEMVEGEKESPKDQEVRVEMSTEGPVDSQAPESCAWCREKLPERPGVNFCPFCGMSVKLVPCPDCGEELELNWRFCIACGTEVSS